MKTNLTILTTCLFLCAQAFATAAPKPNIVIIFADDWGWGDLSCHGHPWLKTPNLDKLASEGTDFQQFNVLSPVCSPSRVGLMTGHYPARYSIHGHFATPQSHKSRGMPDWLDPKAPTLPRFLQQAGYRTGHFGKWHLTSRYIHGSPDPKTYGYDEFILNNAGVEIPEADFHATAPNAVAFIKANKDKPFFINVWLHESHTFHFPTPASMEQWKHLDPEKQVYSAVITDGDNAVGQVLAALKETGVEGNTMVLFSSDNGPEWTGTDKGKIGAYGTYYSIGQTGGLRGRKRSLFEGGVRVPFIVRWPGHTPAGAKNEVTDFTAVDLLPTLCAAAGVTPPADYHGDGENLLAALNGENLKRTRPIFWQWLGPKKGPGDDYWPRLAVREGDWKLTLADESDPVELHNLSSDRAEAKNQAKEQPEIVARLTKLALEWKATLPKGPDANCISAADRANTKGKGKGKGESDKGTE